MRRSDGRMTTASTSPGAKSIAEGHGHSIPSLPGAPAQTKYPPLFPMLLSIVWWISPHSRRT